MEFMSRPTPYSGLGGAPDRIPEFVTVDDVPAPTDSSVSLGVGSTGPFVFDLDVESPHVLVNAPTGLGKSSVARSIAVQRLALGDLVIILDRKMHSHRWARKLAPLVHYADDTPSIGAALVNLGWELQRRNQVVRDHEGDPSEAPVGPRIVVLFEETNATLSQLKALDKSYGHGPGQGSLGAFADILFMGRAVKIHMVAFAQLASYRSGMTADLLENFGIKVLVGYSDKAWKWLVPDCGKYRPAPVGTGRAMVCHAGRASEVQLTFIPEESAAEYVTASVPAQRRARELAGSRRNLPPVWRSAIGR